MLTARIEIAIFALKIPKFVRNVMRISSFHPLMDALNVKIIVFSVKILPKSALNAK